MFLHPSTLWSYFQKLLSPLPLDRKGYLIEQFGGSTYNFSQAICGWLKHQYLPLVEKMASTNPQDRLNRLFDNSPLPSAPTPGELHFSEKELEDRKATDEQRWKLPSTAEYPRKIQSPPKNQPQRDLDILTSSDDDDDYVSSFKKKPSMKPPTINVQPKRRAMPQPNAFGYPAESKIEPKAKIEYLAKGKPSQRSPSAHVDEYSDDDDDNATSSRFCQFTLVAKFPYKYMNDANDRVSRHFFASSKFYDREWAL